MVFLISYTLHKTGQNYADLQEAIKKISGVWWHHTTSVWLVSTQMSAKQIFDYLSPFIDNNDDLMVFKLQNEWHGKLADSTNYDWLRARVF